MSFAVRLQLLEHGTNPLRVEEAHAEHRWRIVRVLEQGEICRVFGLDPVTHRLDLPRMQRAQDGHRRISGYIERHVQTRPGVWEWKPIATLHVVRDGERFRDLDPMDPRDTFNLEQTR